MSGLRAAILSIGDELVFGETLDRNSAWLSERLASLGVATIEHRTVGDELPEIADAYRSLAARASVVISTGGLGPTVDDLTREAMAIAFDGAPSLIEDAAAIASIERWFAGRDRPMPESNRRQALRPPSARSLPNSHGTAPGLSIERDGLQVFALPGPPREMQPMFEAQVEPCLAAAHAGEAIAVETVHAFGDGESALAERIADLMARGRNPSVGTAASPGRVTARIRATGSPAEATAMATAMAEEIATRWSPFAYGRGEQTLPEAAAAAVLAAGCTLSVAESCTAGLIGEMIVSVSGASRFFEGGWIVYSNALKSSQLGVPEALLAAHGAVSEPVAAAMAIGAATRAGTDLALSVTGIAGPTGGSEQKPVGTVFVGLCDRRRGSAEVRRFRFPGDRGDVRDRTAKSALTMLRLHLEGRGDTRLLWEVAP